MEISIDRLDRLRWQAPGSHRNERPQLLQSGDYNRKQDRLVRVLAESRTIRKESA